MKEFKKNEQGLFVCEECGKPYRNLYALRTHIFHTHERKYKEYFDKWIRDETDGKCKICKNETQFKSLSVGYVNCCSVECTNIYIYEQTSKSCMIKFGVKNVYQSEIIKDRCKQTCFNNHGVKYSLQSNKIREKGCETKIKKYGDKNYHNIEQAKLTKKQKYGSENYRNDKKIKDTNFQKYGVMHPMQNKEIFEKSQKHAFLLKKYKNTNIYYRGSYELDFLEKFHSKYPDLCNAPSIKYFTDKQHYYFPDFYIPSLNLIIECKNKWLAEKDKNLIEEKKKATIANGYNYIMILNKNYSNLK